MTRYLLAPLVAEGGINVVGIILFLLLLIACFVLFFWLDSRKQPASIVESKPEVKAESKIEIMPDLEPKPEVAGPPKPDDLTILEGVGPKIQKLLNDAGIHTFSQLAATSVDKLKKVMEDANLRIADPTSWPEQARLAAIGAMDALKTYQDSLKGGRIVK
jgi:predicted flap endonuclease-1-like 5' DNA nuclease